MTYWVVPCRDLLSNSVRYSALFATRRLARLHAAWLNRIYSGTEATVFKSDCNDPNVLELIARGGG